MNISFWAKSKFCTISFVSQLHILIKSIFPNEEQLFVSLIKQVCLFNNYAYSFGSLNQTSILCRGQTNQTFLLII